MNEKDFDIWKRNVKEVFYSQIVLDRLANEKKIEIEIEKEIRKKIKIKRYKNHLDSPAFEHKEELKRKVLTSLAQDYCSFMGFAIN